MKTFGTLKIGDKIYQNFYSYFIKNIEYINGYLKLSVHYDKDAELKPWMYQDIYIPMNHLKANKIKINHLWIFTTKSGYKKFVTQHMTNQIKR